MLRHYTDLAELFFVFRGEGEGEGGTKEKVDPTPANTETPEDDLKAFTPEQQKLVDKIVSGRVKKAKEETTKTIEQLKAVQSRATTTQADKDALEVQIKELQKTLFSKEELAAQEKRELAKKHESELEETRKTAKLWRDRHDATLIQQAILDASAKGDVYNHRQVQNLLSKDARVVEIMDGANPTGRFEVKITFQGKDQAGKPATLDLSPEDVLKQMKAAPEEYGNLFKSGVTGGLGGTNSGGSSGNVSVEALKDTDTYIRERKANRLPTKK